MKKVYVYGSLNYDLVINTERMPKMGETISGNGFFTNSGGKGANQATASSKLGGDTYLIGAVGCDVFGDECLQTLNEYKVNTGFVKRVNVNTGVAMITVCDGDNQIILDPGANYHFKDEDLVKIINENVDGDVFITQLETPLTQVALALSCAKAKGAYTILNPAPAQMLGKDILSNVSLLIVNETELEILSNTELNYDALEESILKGVNILKDSGVLDVLVTLGEKGCYYGNKFYPAFKVNAVDTTGAGDTFIGALASKIASGNTIEESIRFCQFASSITVSRKGAQVSIPYLEEVVLP